MIKDKIIMVGNTVASHEDIRNFLGENGIREEFMQLTDYNQSVEDMDKFVEEYDGYCIVFNTEMPDRMFVITAEYLAETYDVDVVLTIGALGKVFYKMEEFDSRSPKDNLYSDNLTLREVRMIVEEWLFDHTRR